MPFLANLVLRLLLLAAGLVFAAVLALVFVGVAVAWMLRAAWARLTGRPVMPFVMRMGPRGAFEEMMRRGRPQTESRTPRADAAATGRGRLADVTDVDPK